MLEMDAYDGQWAIASIGTDGSDYIGDAAGAIVDNSTLIRAKAKNLDVSDYIKRFDSYSFFADISGSLIITGNTGTNVGDIMVYALKWILE